MRWFVLMSRGYVLNCLWGLGVWLTAGDRAGIGWQRGTGVSFVSFVSFFSTAYMLLCLFLYIFLNYYYYTIKITTITTINYYYKSIVTYINFNFTYQK